MKGQHGLHIAILIISLMVYNYSDTKGETVETLETGVTDAKIDSLEDWIQFVSNARFIQSSNNSKNAYLFNSNGIATFTSYDHFEETWVVESPSEGEYYWKAGKDKWDRIEGGVFYYIEVRTAFYDGRKDPPSFYVYLNSSLRPLEKEHPNSFHTWKNWIREDVLYIPEDKVDTSSSWNFKRGTPTN